MIVTTSSPVKGDVMSSPMGFQRSFKNPSTNCHPSSSTSRRSRLGGSGTATGGTCHIIYPDPANCDRRGSRGTCQACLGVPGESPLLFLPRPAEGGLAGSSGSSRSHLAFLAGVGFRPDGLRRQGTDAWSAEGELDGFLEVERAAFGPHPLGFRSELLTGQAEVALEERVPETDVEIGAERLPQRLDCAGEP
jgi:hypothetical protein